MVDEKYRHTGDPAIRVMEEAAELIKAMSKGLRFGWHTAHPDGGPTNLQRANDELNDLELAFVDLMTQIREGKNG